MKIGFIGAGNMGGAIIRGLIKSNTVKPNNILVNRKNKLELENMQNNLGILPMEDAVELVNEADIIFLAVKPIMFEEVICKIKSKVQEKNRIIVSMAAGLTTEKIKNMFGFDTKIIRIMPNINAEILMSTTAICKNEFVSKEELETVKSIMSGVGMVSDVPEKQFSIFVAIAGCSPAYVYTFIDGLARGAQKMGMNKKQALELVANTVLGSANMYLKSESHPQELVDKVCSPGGTTIEGLCTLEEYKFTPSLVKAVESIVEKDKLMNK